RTLPEALDQAAQSDEGYIFVVGGVETRRSYAELQQASFRVARSLTEAGLRPGDVVALVLGDAEPFLTALFGASMSGLVPASVSCRQRRGYQWSGGSGHDGRGFGRQLAAALSRHGAGGHDTRPAVLLATGRAVDTTGVRQTPGRVVESHLALWRHGQFCPQF